MMSAILASSSAVRASRPWLVLKTFAAKRTLIFGLFDWRSSAVIRLGTPIFSESAITYENSGSPDYLSLIPSITPFQNFGSAKSS